MHSKLKAVQNGHKGAITKLIKKFEHVKRDETTPGIDELSNIASSLQKKLQVIIDLYEKIFAEAEEKEIKMEIPEYDQYILT